MSVIESAESFVRLTEKKHLDQLITWRKESHHRAESCGCPNCQKEAKSAYQALSDEVNRLDPPKLARAITRT